MALCGVIDRLSDLHAVPSQIDEAIQQFQRQVPSTFAWTPDQTR
jgi:hypothetical protein